jgi:hypothetical protein
MISHFPNPQPKCNGFLDLDAMDFTLVAMFMTLISNCANLVSMVLG